MGSATARWWAWGRRSPRVEAEALRLLAQLANMWPGEASLREPAHDSDPAPVLPRADARVIARLRDRLGHDAVSDDEGVRARHAIGQSFPELVRARRGEVRDPPVAVITARSREHVAETLAACAALDLSVVPFGGGTSVTGGVAGPKTPHVTLSLRGLAAMRGLDRTSLVATVDAGMLGPELEAALARDGLTLAHFPQSFERSTVGGWVATRSAGQLSTGVGAIADLVVGLRCIAPAGEIVIPPMPPSSEGPDLREAILGSEGRYGVITDVSLRVRPAPEAAEQSAWLFGSFADGLTAVRAAVQRGVVPDLVRLSDEAETAMLANTPGALLVAGIEGAAADVLRARDAFASIGAGARSLGREPAARWHESRYDAPYLRDALLERGVLADSLETATLWSNVEAVHRAVGDALRAALDPAGRALVLCHVSHAYAIGASLYFTFVAPGGEDAVERWSSAKRAALDAMLANGAVVSHHHGIGRDHREWQARRLGSAGMRVVDAVASTLDPARTLAANR